jgi:hypothetical protein
MSIDGLLVTCVCAAGRTPVAAAAEELVEHVVLVGRDDQLLDRQPHPRATQPANTLPKFPTARRKTRARCSPSSRAR